MRKEHPFDTQAGSHGEVLVLKEIQAAAPAAGEAVGQFYLAADVEVGAAEVLADVVPELRLGEDFLNHHSIRHGG